MIKIVGNNIWRGGQKIGWISGDHIHNHAGERIGYTVGNHIYTHDGKKIGFIEGDSIKSSDGRFNIRVEDNREHVSGGTHSDAARAAVRLLLGN